MKILLTIAYVGTNYQGYQLQKDKPTVSLMLNKAVRDAFGIECNVTGCSRTDSGVHALGYCATVEPKDPNEKITVPIEKIPLVLNLSLPDDISVLDAKEVPSTFHARYDVAKKEYVYKIHASTLRDPFLNKRALEYGKEISDESFEKMQKAASFYIGTHEFDSFMSSGSKIENTERTVYESYLKRNGENIEFHILANGFLYNMVRIMVGTLLDVEKGKIHENTIPDIILAKDRKRSGSTAKADGLYLQKIFYLNS
ncbi:MAG: tRNA pseudouridine(38-40) synthase TruA [Clostridia bacterium]|nr:tRNA pseudouridine(38-40) synthase TruA [Clostridia bacterium]